jgi:hypothetical protein
MKTVSTKTVWHEPDKANIHGTAAIHKPLITESNAQMRKRWCHDLETWTSDSWKHKRDMVRWVVLHVVDYFRKSLCLENTQGRLQSRMSGSVPTVKHGGGSVMVWVEIPWYSVGSNITQHGWITAREYVDRLSNQVHSIISEQQCSFPRQQCPHSHSWNCSIMVRRAWRWTSTSSLDSTITRFEHHWTTLISFVDYSEEQIPTSNIFKATWRCSSRRMV